MHCCSLGVWGLPWGNSQGWCGLGSWGCPGWQVGAVKEGEARTLLRSVLSEWRRMQAVVLASTCDPGERSSSLLAAEQMLQGWFLYILVVLFNRKLFWVCPRVEGSALAA